MLLLDEIRWTYFTVGKIMYCKMNTYFSEKNVYLLCLMRYFKYTKPCKWKRFIRRRDFVMDNPVYTLKASQRGFLFRFWFCHKFWSRRLWYLRLQTVFFVGFIVTCSFVIQLVCFCIALEHLNLLPFIVSLCLFHVLRPLMAIFRESLGCTIIHFNIIFQIRAQINQYTVPSNENIAKMCKI